MPGSHAPIPDNILDHIRRCAATEHAMAHQAPQWQLALDHRRWLLAEVDRLRRELARTTCGCCVFGNHDVRCTCDGADCCHPEAYKQYNPAWGHGKDQQ